MLRSPRAAQRRPRSPEQGQTARPDDPAKRRASCLTISRPTIPYGQPPGEPLRRIAPAPLPQRAIPYGPPRRRRSRRRTQPAYTQQPNYCPDEPEQSVRRQVRVTATCPPDRSNYASWSTRAALLSLGHLVRLARTRHHAGRVRLGRHRRRRGHSGPSLGLGFLAVFAGGVVALVMDIMNKIMRQGRTGLHLRQGEGRHPRPFARTTANPAGSAVVRPGISCTAIINQFFYIDYLWPLWDDKCQTITDKILTTVVVHAPEQ